MAANSLRFDRLIGIDWSGANKNSNSAIFVAEAVPAGGKVRVRSLTRAKSRDAVRSFLCGGDLERHLQWSDDLWPAPNPVGADRVLVGLDFAFGFPEKFVSTLRAGEEPPYLASWRWAERADRHEEHENLRMFLKHEARDWFKFDKNSGKIGGRYRWRRTDEILQENRNEPNPSSVFHMIGGQQVGYSSIRGMAMLQRLLRQGQRDVDLHVWPFHAFDRTRVEGLVLVEMYPAMWLNRRGKSHVPVRVENVDNFFDRYLDVDKSDRDAIRLAAVGDDNALDALAILAGFSRTDITEQLLQKPGNGLPHVAAIEGWIWGTREAR